MSQRNPWYPVLCLLFAALAAMAVPAQAEENFVHHVIFHVDENDPGRMNLVLNNASNVDAYYRAKAEEVQIEIVAYGPGLNMLRSDKSPVVERIQTLSDNLDNIAFLACGNTLKGMKRKEKKDIPLVSQAKIVPAGVVYLMERQQEGWSYIRP